VNWAAHLYLRLAPGCTDDASWGDQSSVHGRQHEGNDIGNENLPCRPSGKAEQQPLCASKIDRIPWHSSQLYPLW